MKPELGSTCGRDSRIRRKAVSTVRGVGERETISGIDDGRESEFEDCGRGFVVGCRERQRRYAVTIVAERDTPIAL